MYNCKRALALLLTLAVLLSALPATALASDETTAEVSIEVTYGQTEARTMLDMVNEFRTGDEAWAWNSDDTEKIAYSGLQPLVYDYELEATAMQRAAEIALSFSHTRPNGTSCATAYIGSWYSRGENIAAGNRLSSAQAVFTGWQETDKTYIGQGHRRNMLSSSFTAIGIGHVYFNGIHYWVQEFRNPASDAAETEANDGKTSVDIELLLSDAEVSVSAEPSSLSVVCGQSQALPTLSTTVRMSEAWPDKANTVGVDYTWSVEDSQLAAISGDTVTGVQEGTTALTTAALGQTVSVPLTVEKAPCIHSYDEAVTKPASCTETGVKTYTCAKCGDSYTETIPAAGHTTETRSAKEPGCTEAGYTGDAVCTVCGKTVEQGQSIPAAGHSYQSTVTAPTCTQQGYTTHTCSRCGDSYADAPTAALGHSWDKGQVTKAATYTEEGVKTYTCTRCNGTRTESIPKSVPAAPTITKAENVNGGIKVTWGAVAGAEQYRLYVYSESTGSWKKVTDTASTSATFNGISGISLKSGTSYRFTVKCIRPAVSSYDKTGKTITYIAQPVLSSAANATSGVTVQWGKVTGAAKYRVFRKVSGASKWDKVTDTTSTSCTDTTSKSGTTYIYTVRCISGDGKSYTSSYDAKGKTVLRLSNPSVTVSNTASGVAVKWGKVTGANGYYVYRKTDSGKYSKIATIKSGSTVSYTDTAVKSKNGTTYTYTYTVRAYNGSTLSSYAGKKIVRLTAPTISSVTNSSGRTMTVKWNKNSSATGYQVYYKTGSTVKTVTVKGSSSLSKTISGLTKGSTYTVYVRSYKTVSGVNYYSAWSGSKTVKISK